MLTGGKADIEDADLVPGSGGSLPNTPSCSEPADNATDVSLTDPLKGTTYSDPDGDPQTASQWQIFTDAGLADKVWDNTRTSDNLETSDLIPAGTLAGSTEYYWQVRYQDVDGWSEWSTAWSFTTVGAAPVVNAGSDGTIDEGGLFSRDGSFVDPDSTSWTMLVNYGDGRTDTWTTVDESFHLRHTYADNGIYDVTVTVTDDGAMVGTDTLIVTVNNVVPGVWVRGRRILEEGGLLDVQDIAMFTDPGFDNPEGGTVERFTYTIDWNDGTDADSGDAAIDVMGGEDRVTRGTFDGTHTFADDGRYSVAITVTDDDGGSSVTRYMTVVVNNQPPVIEEATVAPTSFNEGEEATLSVDFTDSGVADNHIARVDWGDGSTVDESPLLPAGSRSFSRPHVYKDDNPTGTPSDTYTVTVWVGDGVDWSAPVSRTVTVNNLPPQNLDAGVDQTGNEGQEIVFDGSFSDPGTLDTHAIRWDFGDGTSDESGTLTPTHVYADNGSYTVQLTVTDDDGGSATDTLTVTVNNVAPSVDAGTDQTAGEGQTVTLAATFNDKGTKDAHTASIDWGDETSVQEGVVTESPFGPPGSTAGMDGAVSGTHVYAENGTYTVTVTVTDDDGLVGTDTLVVTVNNLPPAVNAGPDDAATEGQEITFAGAFTDAGTSDTHTILWDFGDGTTDDSGTLSPTHVYADNGIYTVRLTVTDDDGDDGTDTLVVTVSNVDSTVDAGTDQTVDEGQSVAIAAVFNDRGTKDTHTASVDWGDGTPIQAVTVTESPIGPPGSTAGMGGAVSGAHVYADNGTYTVTITVTDDDGGIGTDTLVVTVENLNPSLFLLGNLEVEAGSLLSVTDLASFTDPGFANPSNPGPEKEETFTYTINWGDDTPEVSGSASVDQLGSTGIPTAGSFDGSHTYADPGTYIVTVRVTDDDTGYDEQEFEVLVTAAAGGQTLEAMFEEDGDETAGPPETLREETPTAAEPGAMALMAAETLANQPPTVWAVGEQSVDQGSMSIVDLGAFRDDDSDGPFQYRIDWNDGTAADTGTADIDSAGPPAWGSFDGQHVYYSSGAYLVEVTVTDEQGNTSEAETFELTVTNVAPVAVDDHYAYDGVGVFEIDALQGVLANDYDTDGDALSALPVGVPMIDPAKGSVDLNPDGSFTYTPPYDGFSDRVTFQYFADDERLQSEPATVMIDVGLDYVVSGFVYADADRDNGPNVNEGVPGVLVTLSGEDGFSQTTWTDDEGWYGFGEVPVGTYTITERQPYAMVDGGTNTISGVEVGAAGDAADQNFRELGLKSQYVYSRLSSTSVTPVGSAAWRTLLRQIIGDGEEDAGRSPAAPSAVAAQIVQLGSELVVRGTDGDDTFAFVAAETAGGQHSVTLNGQTYLFDAATVTQVRFDGGRGSDTVSLTGSSEADYVETAATRATLESSRYRVNVIGAETIRVDAGSGTAVDTALLVDTAADDSLVAETGEVRLAAYYYDQVLRGFEQVTASSTHGGNDVKRVAEAIDYVLVANDDWISS